MKEKVILDNICCQIEVDVSHCCFNICRQDYFETLQFPISSWVLVQAEDTCTIKLGQMLALNQETGGPHYLDDHHHDSDDHDHKD